MENNKQEWLKIDMHMHSQYSKKYDLHKVKEITAKEYFYTLINKLIKIFIITYHNSF